MFINQAFFSKHAWAPQQTSESWTQALLHRSSQSQLCLLGELVLVDTALCLFISAEKDKHAANLMSLLQKDMVLQPSAKHGTIPASFWNILHR